MRFESIYTFKDPSNELKKWDKNTGHLYLEKVYVSANSADRFIEILEICFIAEKAAEIAKRIKDQDTIIYKDRDRERHRFYDDQGVFISPEHQKAKMFSDAMGICEFYLNRFTPLNDEVLSDYMQVPKFIIDSMLEYSRNPKGTESCDFTADQVTLIPKVTDRNGSYSNTVRSRVSYNNVPEGSNLFKLFHDREGTLLYVRLIDNPLPDELMNLYENYWRSTGRESQLNAAYRLIPLQTLINYLQEKYDPSKVPSCFNNAIMTDFYDFSSHRIYAYDGTIGRVGPRDYDLEKSQSDLGKICNADKVAIFRLCTFARILHCVLMNSICEKTKTSLFSTELAFETPSMHYLMDQHLFAYNHHARLIFVTESNYVGHYVDILKSIGMKECTDGFEAPAPECEDAGVSWLYGKDTFRMRKNQPTYVPMSIFDSTQSDYLNQLKQTLDSISKSDTFPREVILVTDEKHRGLLNSIISRLQRKDIVRCIVTVGEYDFRTTREDLFNIEEIGISDIRDLYGIHVDDDDMNRIICISDLLQSQGKGKCIDAETALKGMDDLIKDAERIGDPMYRIPFIHSLTIASKIVKEESRMRRAALK